MENNKSKECKKPILVKGLLLVALALCSLYSCTLPTISNEFLKTSWLNKIAISISIICGIALCIFLIISYIKNRKKNIKYFYNILYVFPLLAIEAVNIIAIFDHEIFGKKSVAVGLVFFIIIFIELFVSIRILFQKYFGQENTPVVLIVLTIISFAIAAVNEVNGNIEPANLYYKLCFGLAYLVAIALYTHKFIYQSKKQEQLISNIIGAIFWGALITITFPYYIQWCGVTGTNFEAFISVYAALLGGGITLAGVAWTIKDANDKRNEDLQRLEIQRDADLRQIEEQRKEDLLQAEEQRKEEDRRKHRPIIHVFAGKYSGLKTDIDVITWLKDTEHISKTLTKNLKTANRICSCYFGNTEFSNAYVWGIKINGHMTNFDSIRYIKKESYFYLDFSNRPIYTEKSIETISLILEDVLENLYELPLEYSFIDASKLYVIQGNNQSFYIGSAKKEYN